MKPCTDNSSSSRTQLTIAWLCAVLLVRNTTNLKVLALLPPCVLAAGVAFVYRSSSITTVQLAVLSGYSRYHVISYSCDGRHENMHMAGEGARRGPTVDGEVSENAKLGPNSVYTVAMAKRDFFVARLARLRLNLHFKKCTGKKKS